MILTEAIEIKELRGKAILSSYHPKWIEADNLSIEALKFTLAVRGTILQYATLPLPGETEEGS